ncbi:MAG: purine-nucleoside phosphorylase [Clostridiales bacterium]
MDEDTNQKLQRCLICLRQYTDFRPDVAVVLGSGLGEFAEKIKIETIVNYQQIQGFPRSTVDSHKGRLVFGFVREVPVVIMQGRVHYYEGYAMDDVVLPIRLLGLLGAKALLLTNAAGGVNTDFQVGDLMLITDQISSFVPSPLRGPNLDVLGLRFPDMSRVYHRELGNIIAKAAASAGIGLRQGVYLQFTGPAFETPQEIKMARILGADAVGMSTACEAVAAHHMGMLVAGISCITNMAAGILDQPLSHLEVGETAQKVAPVFQRLMQDSVAGIGAYVAADYPR